MDSFQQFNTHCIPDITAQKNEADAVNTQASGGDTRVWLCVYQKYKMV